jgi:hypothetical protein
MDRPRCEHEPLLEIEIFTKSPMGLDPSGHFLGGLGRIYFRKIAIFRNNF